MQQTKAAARLPILALMGEEPGLGHLGIGDVRDPAGNGVVYKCGGVGAGRSVHDVQIRGGAAVDSIVGTVNPGHHGLAVIGVD